MILKPGMKVKLKSYKIIERLLNRNNEYKNIIINYYPGYIFNNSIWGRYIINRMKELLTRDEYEYTICEINDRHSFFKFKEQDNVWNKWMVKRI